MVSIKNIIVVSIKKSYEHIIIVDNCSNVTCCKLNSMFKMIIIPAVPVLLYDFTLMFIDKNSGVYVGAISFDKRLTGS